MVPGCLQAVLQFLQMSCIRIDHGDIVLFVGEVFCQGAAHLAGPENDNFHGLGSSYPNGPNYLRTLKKSRTDCKGGRGVIVHIAALNTGCDAGNERFSSRA